MYRLVDIPTKSRCVVKCRSTSLQINFVVEFYFFCERKDRSYPTTNILKCKKNGSQKHLCTRYAISTKRSRISLVTSAMHYYCMYMVPEPFIVCSRFATTSELAHYMAACDCVHMHSFPKSKIFCLETRVQNQKSIHIELVPLSIIGGLQRPEMYHTTTDSTTAVCRSLYNNSSSSSAVVVS